MRVRVCVYITGEKIVIGEGEKKLIVLNKITNDQSSLGLSHFLFVNQGPEILSSSNMYRCAIHDG